MKKMDSPDIIETWIASHGGRWCDVLLAGFVFGGRHGESPQEPKRHQILPDGTIEIHFGTTEKLTVTAPRGIRVSDNDSLVISDADRACFGWHYYGKPQSDETWCEEIWVRIDDFYHRQSRGILTEAQTSVPANHADIVRLA